MQSVAMQMKKNDQAAVVLMAAPSLYCRKPSWMDEHEVGGWCFESPKPLCSRLWLTEHLRRSGSRLPGGELELADAQLAS